MASFLGSLFKAGTSSSLPLWSGGSSIQVRSATKRASGSTKNTKSSSGKRLGVRKFQNDIVQAGEILVKQRGLKFKAGQNVVLAADHSLYASEPGYVKFYSMPRDLSKTNPFLPISEGNPAGNYPGSSLRPPIANPRDMCRYVGIVADLDDVLPRDLERRGRERRQWLVKEKVVERLSIMKEKEMRDRGELPPNVRPESSS